MRLLFFIGFLTFTFAFANVQGQDKKSKKEIREEKKAQQIENTKSIVESGTFVFKATNANPMGGSTVNLTTEYDVKITQDSIYSYLPYYGRAYNASYGGTDSPMVFNSKFESISSEETKKGYRVKVVTKNGNDRLEFNFHISETGSISLNVTSINRQSISYFGNLEIAEQEKEE